MKAAKQLYSRGLKRWFSCRSPDAMVYMKEMKKNCLMTVIHAKRDAWRGWCDSFSNTSSLKNLWSRFKYTMGKVSRPVVHVDPAAKAAELCAQFQKRSAYGELSTRVRASLEKSAAARQLNIVEHCGMSSDADALFTIQELARALHDARVSAPGTDDISVLLLKNAHSSFKLKLLEAINLSWSTGYMRLKGRRADIVPIPKKDGYSRPISLLPVVDKLMERMVLARLNFTVRDLHVNLTGFRCGRSAIKRMLLVSITSSDPGI